ncbi:MAG TPA: hypothetical protein VGB45_15175, partial [Abditibacterium sp.]
MLPVLAGPTQSEAKAAPKSAAQAAKPAGKQPVSLFKVSGPSAGVALTPGLAPAKHSEDDHENGHKPVVGRTTPLQKASFAALLKIKAGQLVQLPLAGGKVVEGIVNIVRVDKGWTRVGGSLSNGSGSFSLSYNDGKVGGFIQQKKLGLAHRIDQSGDAAQLRETLLSNLVCNIPRWSSGARGARPVGAPPIVPILNSRLSATAQLYLDFDGETVTDPLWDEGRTIVAPAFDLSETEITDIFNRVKEDFAPFNVNITTDKDKYASAPVGKRMRCIMTPNDAALPGTGGGAYLTSFRNAGTGFFTSDIPCWVFNGGVIGISETISHELGHTFGLNHDGRNLADGSKEEYFAGHGDSSTTGWAPIMGSSFSKPVAQWSKGEYALANNVEDDVAIIGGRENGIGFAADEDGNSTGRAKVLSLNGTINQNGVLSEASDVDFYSFSTLGGRFEVTATGAAPSPNLDIALELRSASGNVVASDNAAGELSAGISAVLEAGKYFLKVEGVGDGDVTGTGYSDYGSIGAYSLAGSFLSAPSLVVTSSTVLEGDSQATANFTFSLSYAPTEAVSVDYATADGTAT